MAKKSNKPTLYSRFGEHDAIEATVKAFKERVLADPLLADFFSDVDLDWLTTNQVQFFEQALGGPANYDGADMKRAYRKHKITQEHFDAVAKHLAATLTSLGIEDALVAEVISAVAPLADDIINTSPESPGQKKKNKDRNMSTSTKAQTTDAAERNDYTAQMVQQSPANIMLVDTDLNITYVNDQSFKTLKVLEAAGKINFKVDDLVGMNIDSFHENPPYQRGILKDFKNQLPRNAEIKIGGEDIDLQVDAITDDEGNFVGSMATWAVISDRKMSEAESAKVQSMMENMPINVLLVNNDLEIVYANKTSVTTLKSIQDQLNWNVDELMGMCIDQFHKNPAHQRGIIGDFKNRLPMTSEIVIGKEDIALQVDAVLDAEGEFVGAMATWSVISEQKRMEKEQAEGQERERAAAEELQTKVDSMLGVVQAAAGGDLTQTVEVSGADAIGQMGEGLSDFLKNLRESISDISENAQTLAGASEELTAVSLQMSANSEQTTTQAQVVADGSKQVSENVQTVSSGTEEMTASIKEIAKNAAQAADVASEAVSVAGSTNDTITKLGDSSTEIGQVIKVITSIAQQTNLLALNATIEAARAGDAGKGFAVVANEVKELAKETAKATEDISNKIAAIQTDTKESVEAIENISTIIGQINDIQGTIASSVEEQSATTNEMARNVADANKGSGEISTNIEGVAKAAQETSQGASDVEKSASDLSKMAVDLQEMVGKFTF